VDIGNDACLIGGDLITPGFSREIAPQVSGLSAVFLGNTAITLDDLGSAPDWLESTGPEEYTSCGAKSSNAAMLSRRSASAWAVAI